MNKDECFIKDNTIERRKFLAQLSKASGAALFFSLPISALAKVFEPGKETWTVGQVMGLFIKEIPSAPFPNTVDTLKAGNPEIVVTGIITTMFATIKVIHKAIDLGANFIICHEPTFYNHADETEWLANDDVYQYKMELLSKHNIAVWRNHDYIHSMKPDGVRMGVLKQLGWENYYNANMPDIVMLPPLSLKNLINDLKEKLEIKSLRYIGDLNQPCHKIALLPGAAGGRRQIQAISKEKPDVLVCGEIQEWETAEYVRDAISKGNKISVIVLGHIASEEPGSEFMAKWLHEKIPGIKTTHIPSGNSLSFL